MNNEIAIAKVASFIRDSSATVAFTGAGISTPSGIPDFRSHTSGMWEKVNPMEVASLFGFRMNPSAFYNWVYPLAQLTLSAQPNAAHLALARLEAMSHLIAIITQNIDMLHQRAGNSLVYELHGNFREATCTHCFTAYPGLPLLEQFLTDKQVPRCPRCGGVIKPNVILFGEQLPLQVLRAAQDVARRADVMLIIGSSLEVAPASDIPIIATRCGAKLVIINLEPTDFDQKADVVIHEDAAVVLPKIMQCLEEMP